LYDINKLSEVNLGVNLCFRGSLAGSRFTPLMPDEPVAKYTSSRVLH